MKQLDDVLPIIGSVANVAEQGILITAAERYSVLHRFSPRFLRSSTSDRARRTTPCYPPTSFSRRWIATARALCQTDRRLYETAVLTSLRDRLKGSGIWVAGSRDYRAFEDYLLPTEAVRDGGISDETDPTRYVAGRARSRPDAEWNVAARPDHRGAERCRWLDRIRRSVHSFAHRQSGGR